MRHQVFFTFVTQKLNKFFIHKLMDICHGKRSRTMHSSDTCTSLDYARDDMHFPFSTYFEAPPKYI